MSIDDFVKIGSTRIDLHKYCKYCDDTEFSYDVYECKLCKQHVLDYEVDTHHCRKTEGI